jgi:hypothetical protein
MRDRVGDRAQTPPYARAVVFLQMTQLIHNLLLYTVYRVHRYAAPDKIKDM